MVFVTSLRPWIDRKNQFLYSRSQVSACFTRRSTMILSQTAIAKSVRRAMLAGILLVSGWDSLSEAFAQGTAEQASAPLILRSTLENLSRGFIPAGLPPALRIKSGQTVEIETFSHHGFVDDPVAFFKGYGISPEMILPDLIAASKKLPRPKDGGTHVLTGPIYI